MVPENCVGEKKRRAMPLSNNNRSSKCAAAHMPKHTNTHTHTKKKKTPLGQHLKKNCILRFSYFSM